MYDKLMGDIANQAKLEEFEGIFGNAIGIAESKSTVVGAPTCWKMIKDEGAVDKFLTNGSKDDKPLFSGRLGGDETALKVEALQCAVLSVATGDTEITDEDSSQEMPTSGTDDNDDDVAYSPNLHFIVDGKEEECLAVYDNVQLTKYMEKDMNALDKTLRERTTKKTDDLVYGRGGKATRKPLVGFKNLTIYETYVDQSKGGHRILWTEHGNQKTVLIWHVVYHDAVSGKGERMNYATEDKIIRLLESATVLYGDNGTADLIFLDAETRVPLTVYDVPRGEVTKLACPDWKPHLALTEEEKNVVNTDGTVLLLGRSGTG